MNHVKSNMSARALHALTSHCSYRSQIQRANTTLSKSSRRTDTTRLTLAEVLLVAGGLAEAAGLLAAGLPAAASPPASAPASARACSCFRVRLFGLQEPVCWSDRNTAYRHLFDNGAFWLLLARFLPGLTNCYNGYAWTSYRYTCLMLTVSKKSTQRALMMRWLCKEAEKDAELLHVAISEPSNYIQTAHNQTLHCSLMTGLEGTQEHLNLSLLIASS